MNSLLIPVDLSDSSVLACRIGFALALRLRLHPVLLHSFISPFMMLPQPSAVLENDGDSVDVEMEEYEDIRDAKALQHQASLRFNKFCRKLKDLQRSGDIVNVEFGKELMAGVPEDVIREYVREKETSLVVMATRGASKRREELIGSITVEVIDSCRVPVFTVPENMKFESVGAIRRLVFFCNMDKNDLKSVDSFMQMFGCPEIELYLVPVNDLNSKDVFVKLDDMCEILHKKYPDSGFCRVALDLHDFRAGLEDYLKSNDIQMLVVPNKRQSVIRRLFNPGIAHRILFEKDLPMLALPV